MKAILIILTVISFLAFGWFFINATTIDPQEIQSADQQAAAALELIKAGLAWLALCIGLTGLAIIEYLKPVAQYSQQNQGWRTCSKCGTVSKGFAETCHKCGHRFPPIQGTPPVQPEPPPVTTQGHQPPVEPQAQEKSPRPSRIKLSHRERAVLVIMAILIAGCATFLGAYFLANHQDTVGKVTHTEQTAQPGHFSIPSLGEITWEADQRGIAGWKALSDYCSAARRRMDAAHNQQLEDIRLFAHRNSRSYDEYESRGAGLLDKQDWEIIQLQAECNLRTQELKAAGVWGSP